MPSTDPVARLRRSLRSRPWATAAVATALVLPLTAAGLGAAGAAEDPAPETRQQAYAAAAEEYDVPESVLLGVSYLESRWDTHQGKPSTDAGFGPMHLTDAPTVLAEDHHGGTAEDPRGDTERPVGEEDFGPALTTLYTAAELTGADARTLRTDAAENIEGGAALLASYQEDLGAPLTADPAAWYGAVARYAGASYAQDAATFADEVYATIRSGAARTTDDGQAVTLAADPSVAPQEKWLAELGLPQLENEDVECPEGLGCEWIPATYRQTDPDDIEAYVNHDKANRPHDQKIEYIVIHDTEGRYPGVIDLVQSPTRAASWQYTLRSSDGHIAQHIKAKDVAWQAGNWNINAKSIGLEHEGFAKSQGVWYTEAMYRTSAKLVRYLAAKYDVPLDRTHIIGHDNVPGTVTSTIPGMHWDPGPYWDWKHYFDLLRSPLRAPGGSSKSLVMIKPEFDVHQPQFTGCSYESGSDPKEPCPLAPSSSVILHSQPDADSPLLVDVGLHPDGRPSDMHVSDVGSRASTGQVYAVAERKGDWVAIWYHGLKGWFHNPKSHPVAQWTGGKVVKPKPGRESVPVYGRAYPEEAAYPAEIPYQPISAHPYEFKAGQAYSYGGTVPGEYYRARSFDGSAPGDRTVVRGETKYHIIQIGHRIGFVNADDVVVTPVS